MQWGWGDVGTYASAVNGGDKPPKTPELDRMAREGSQFTRFHTLASVCSPSRQSWLTGSWPLAANLSYIYLCDASQNAKYGQANFLSMDTPFVARTLKQNGYRTAHYGYCARFLPRALRYSSLYVLQEMAFGLHT